MEKCNVYKVIVIGLVSFVLASCGGRAYVTDQEMPEIDHYTMSLRLDRKDIDRLYLETRDAILGSSMVSRWERRAVLRDRPVVAIFPVDNHTGEAINHELEAMLSKFETDLVNKTPARTISLKDQEIMIAETIDQTRKAFNPKKVAQFGNQLGAQYFMTGKVYDADEVINGERRVQYFLFVQVINVETSEIEFQNEAALTKGLMR